MVVTRREEINRRKMNIERNNRFLKIYYIVVGIVCSLIVAGIMFLTVRQGADLIVVVFLGIFLLLVIGLPLTFSYLYNLKHLEIDSQKEQKSIENYLIITISSLLMLIIAIFGLILILKKMEFWGAAVLIVSSAVFFFLIKKRLP